MHCSSSTAGTSVRLTRSWAGCPDRIVVSELSPDGEVFLLTSPFIDRYPGQVNFTPEKQANLFFADDNVVSSSFPIGLGCSWANIAPSSWPTTIGIVVSTPIHFRFCPSGNDAWNFCDLHLARVAVPAPVVSITLIEHGGMTRGQSRCNETQSWNSFGKIAHCT